MATATKNSKKKVSQAASKAPDPVSRGANVAAAATHAAKGTRAAGQAAGAVVARGRKPLLIGGAALAGVAAGLAITKRK